MLDWANSGTLNDLGPGAEQSGYDLGLEPDPHFENLYKASASRFLDWCVRQHDANQPIIDDVVTQQGTNIIVGTKELGSGGVIQPNTTKDPYEAIITDNRDDGAGGLAEGFDLEAGPLVYRTKIDGEGERVRHYTDWLGGIIVTRNAFYTLANGWCADDKTKPATCMRIAGSSVEYRRQNATGAPWGTTWERQGGSGLRSGQGSDGTSNDGFGSLNMTDTNVIHYANGSDPGSKVKLFSERIGSAWGFYVCSTQTLNRHYNVAGVTISGANNNIIDVDFHQNPSRDANYSFQANGTSSVGPIIVNAAPNLASQGRILVYDASGNPIDCSVPANNVFLSFHAQGDNA